MTTLQALARERIQERHDAQGAKSAKERADAARLQQEHPDVIRIFQRDFLLGAKLPKGLRIKSIVHGHRISALYAGGRSIVAQHDFQIVDDSLVVPIFGGLIQLWDAKKNSTGGRVKKTFDDFLDAFIWLFYRELMDGARD